MALHVKFQGRVILLEVPTKQAPNHKTKPLDPELDQERSPLDEEPEGWYRFTPEPSLPKKEVLRWQQELEVRAQSTGPTQPVSSLLGPQPLGRGKRCQSS